MAEQKPPEQPSIEDRFRETFRDMIVVVEKLAPHCQSVSELTGMLRLALDNPGQLRLLMSQVVPPEFREK